MSVDKLQYTKMDTLFEKVDKNNLEHIKRFRKIVDKVWEEQGFEVTYSQDGEKFILKDVNGVDVGTFQFSLYKNNKTNECDEIYNFGDLQEIKNNYGYVIEIDKFALCEEGRFENTVRLLYSLYFIAKANNIKYGIALFNPKLFPLFKRRRIPYVDFPEHTEEFQGAPVTPGYIDFEKMYSNSDKVRGLKEIEAEFAIKEIVNS